MEKNKQFIAKINKLKDNKSNIITFLFIYLYKFIYD